MAMYGTLALLLVSCFSTFGLFSFLNYISLIVLLQLSRFFPPLLPSTQHPNSLRQSPHHCSCPWVMCTSSLPTRVPILHFTFPWLCCNYLFVLLNPLTSSPIPPHAPPIRKPSKCSLYPCSYLCSSCLLSLYFRVNC